MTAFLNASGSGFVYDDPDNEPERGTAAHALWLVHWHLEWENPDQLDQLGQLYTDDITWELHIPGAVLAYAGKKNVLENYTRLLKVLQDLKGELLDAYATPTRVFLDQQISYDVGPGAEDFMDPSILPTDRHVRARMLHNFRVADGRLSREQAYIIPSAP
jgi:ketosteroid isomerase-like protein